MADLLVKLYDLEFESKTSYLESEHGIKIFRPLAPSKSKILHFIKEAFSQEWADECEAAFANQPITCFIATDNRNQIIGFAAYEATCKAFFGPIGVHAEYRKYGVGRELLLKSLEGLKQLGYAYAIIGGGSGKFEFYNKTCGAIKIEDSEPGIYQNMV